MPGDPDKSTPSRPAWRRVALLVNTRSRRGGELFPQAVERLEARGFALAARHEVTEPARLGELACQEIERGSDLLLVGGGDGTVGTVAAVCAHRAVALGLLPFGTGNNFATRTLGIPATLDGALEVIAAGRVARVDLGRVNGRYFVNTASLGISSAVAPRTPPRLKRALGVLAYGVVGIRDLFVRQGFPCRIELPGGAVTLRLHQIVAANGNYFGVARLSDEGQVESRRLLLLAMESTTGWRRAWSWLRLLAGRAHRIEDARRFETPRARIEADPPQPVDVDGEVLTRTPAELEVAAGALRVLVPEAFDAS